MGFLGGVKDLVGKKDESIPQNFLSLAISLDKVEAAVWSLTGAQVKILGLGSQSYKVTEELTASIGLAIDQAGAAAGVAISQVVFGLPSSWIQSDQIIDPYDRLLKKICADLELDPLAFVPTFEAVAHFIHVSDLAPPTALVVNVGQDWLSGAILKSGKVDKSFEIKRGESVAESLASQLVKVAQDEPIPSKILLFDGKEMLDKVKNELLAFNWLSLKFENGENVFLHFPKIETLDEYVGVKAVAEATSADLSVAPISNSPEEVEAVVPIERKPINGDNFDFLEETDVLAAETAAAQATAVPPQASTEVSRPPNFEAPLSPTQARVAQEEAGTQGNFVSNILSSLPLPHFQIPPRFRKLTLPTVGLGILIALLIVALLLPSATVTIFAKPQVLERDAQISVVAGGAASGETQIAGVVTEITKSGSQKAVVTGKKTVGDKAKGTVNVFNKTNEAKSFSAGTTITSPSKQVFNLDNAVTIASRSATIEGITYGKATTTVSALAIGVESNISGGQDFSVGGFDTSQYLAHNDQAFSGGSSREVTVVGDDDQKRLEEELKKGLIDQARSEIAGKTAGQVVLDKAVSSSTVSKKFDKNVGDEASVLNLSMEQKMKVTSYNGQDLAMVLAKLVENSVPDGYSLNSKEIETQEDVLTYSPNGDLTLHVRFKVNLLPKMDENLISTKIAGQSEASALNFISQIPRVSNATVIVKPKLPGPLAGLPRITKRIKIVVTADKN